MDQLIQQLEQATEDDQPHILRRVLGYARDRSWITEERFHHALRMLDAGAFIDAALTLVPEGAGIELRRYWLTTGIGDAVRVALDGPEAGRVWSAVIAWGTDGQTAEAEDTPNAALALCIAALRARS